MNRKAIEELKQQIPLLEYLQAHGWQPTRSIRSGGLMGLCPLHADHSPSFWADPCRNLFYCYGCTRGGDVIRFAELYHQVKFPQAVALLREWSGVTPLLEEAARFYQLQLSRHREAVSYLQQRGLNAPESGLCCHPEGVRPKPDGAEGSPASISLDDGAGDPSAASAPQDDNERNCLLNFTFFGPRRGGRSWKTIGHASQLTVSPAAELSPLPG